MVVLDPVGQITATYDKHHLVPFGEYMPLRPVLSALGLHVFADMFGDGFGEGEGAQTLDFGALGKGLPLICYEAVFAHQVGEIEKVELDAVICVIRVDDQHVVAPSRCHFSCGGICARLFD